MFNLIKDLPAAFCLEASRKKLTVTFACSIILFNFQNVTSNVTSKILNNTKYCSIKGKQEKNDY